MQKIMYFVKAARLRTLPLSVSGVLVGAGWASSHDCFKPNVFLLCLLTTLLLQILSNYANDLGDGVKGTDTHRKGEARMIASGLLSIAQMKYAIILASVIALLTGLTLIHVSFPDGQFIQKILFLFLGLSAIGAAIKYTVGHRAYGYYALGDVSVYIFFGLLSTMGSYYLMCLKWDAQILLPASVVGLWSMAVLNLNNMRDVKTDKMNHKFTMAMKFGWKGSRIYHFILLVCGVFLAMWYAFSFAKYLALFAILPVFLHLYHMYKIHIAEEYDGQLKVIALSTFFYSFLFFIDNYYI